MSDCMFRVVIAGDNAYPRIERSFGSLTHLALKAPKVALIPVDSMTWIVIRAFAGDNYRRVTTVWASEVTFRLLLLFLLPSEHHSPFPRIWRSGWCKRERTRIQAFKHRPPLRVIVLIVPIAWD